MGAFRDEEDRFVAARWPDAFWKAPESQVVGRLLGAGDRGP